MLFITLTLTTLLSRTSSASSISSVSTRNLQQQNPAGSPWISVNFTLANGTTYTDQFNTTGLTPINGQDAIGVNAGRSIMLSVTFGFTPHQR